MAESGLSDEDDRARIRQRVLQNKILDEVATDAEVSDEEIAVLRRERRNAVWRQGQRAPHPGQEGSRREPILAQLDKGADFAQIAKAGVDRSGQRTAGGDLGEFGPGQMVPEFEKAVFSADVGEIVGPVKTEFGFHIIQVQQKTERLNLPR